MKGRWKAKIRMVFIAVFLTSAYFSVTAQVGTAKKAIKAYQKDKLNKAEKLVKKALVKDSLMPASLYAEAALLFDSRYSKFDIDKAYNTILLSRKKYSLLDEKVMEKHVDAGIDLLTIDKLKKEIEKSAFYRAVDQNTEDRFNFFLSKFQPSEYTEKAIGKRDSLAFINATSLNTYQAYEKFMEKYPDAKEKEEAKKRYEKLYFNKSTADGKLESYIKFLEVHPTTSYRTEAERNIFEITTADNSVNSYYKFMAEYPKSHELLKARRNVYHILSQIGKLDQFPKKWLSDSLKQVMEFDQIGPLFLFTKLKKYGFSDLKGNEIIAPQYDLIDSDLLCNFLEEDFFSTNKGIIARNGRVIFKEKIEDVEDLGYGILKIKQFKNVKLLHKSGWPIVKNYINDAKVLNGQFIAFKTSGKWGLMTFSGRVIIEAKFDDIKSAGPFYILEKDEQYDALSTSILAKIADQNTFVSHTIFTDYELLNENYLWLQSPYGETVFDEQLNEIVPYNDQDIKTLKKGILVKKQNEIQWFNNDLELLFTEESDKVIYNDSFVAVKVKQKWKMYDLTANSLLGKFDSVATYGQLFSVGISGDSTTIFFENGVSKYLKNVQKIKLLGNQGSSEYINIKVFAKNDSRYFDVRGEEIILGDFDEVSPLGMEYLVVSKKGKKGLYSNKGEELLAPKYDAIANNNNGGASFLSGKKIGLVNLNSGIFIKAEYDRNITTYNENLLIAEKSELFGLVDIKGKEITDFFFEEIKYWNDSTALVKHNFLWRFLDIYNNKMDVTGFKAIFPISDTHEENVMIALGDEGYGVFNSTKGVIITPTFNDIINLGSSEEPLYFTEKHVEEAGFYVVIYYNKNGELIRKQVYDAADYMLIYCEQ